MRLLLASCTLLLAAPHAASAQPIADTTLAWQGYARTSTCHVQVYPAEPGADRPHTVVLRELAESRGPTTLDDARHLVELIGRQQGLDPAAATWIFHWGTFSFEGASSERRRSRKELFLRATFRRTPAGHLGAPAWRLVTKAEVEVLTDRRYVAPSVP